MDLDSLASMVRSRCEKYLVVENLQGFYACLEDVTGGGWVETDATMFDDAGNIVRLLACRLHGDEVVSVLAFYTVSDGDDGGLSYDGLDIDASSVEDVRRVVGDVCG